MALPPIIEKKQRDWLFKVIEQQSKQPERDMCLMAFFFMSACTTLQINMIEVKDVLHKTTGKLNKEFTVKGTGHTFYLVNNYLCKLTYEYLQYRVKNKICMGTEPSEFLGLSPNEPLFISSSSKGETNGFSVVKKITSSGNESFTCNALNRHLKTLMQLAGVEGSILSGRRTLAVNLFRKGYDLAHIHSILANKTLETTQKIITTDTIDMARIAKDAF